MNFIGSKRMETERLILRPTEESDLKVLWDILCIPEVNKYYLVGKFNTDWEKELPWQIKKLERANDGDVFQWSIVLKDTNECIGQISVQENGEDKSIRDIGWFLNPKYHRLGYTYEAAIVVLKYMFDEVEISSIESGTAVCNPASYKLMEKLGFEKVDVPNIIVNYTYGGETEVNHYTMHKKNIKKLKPIIRD